MTPPTPPQQLSGWYAAWGKRLLDLLIAAPMIILLAPLLIMVAAAIRLTSRGPALFVQQRLGARGRTFAALKFRTMINKARIPDTVRFTGTNSDITPIGRLLRRTKMDELPQLINVIKGDMSIVGPRPQLPVQLGEFDDNAKWRLLVRPGLTGMAQTHGNVQLTWPERWHYDALYVRNVSLLLDVRLMLRTIAVLALGEEVFTQHPSLESENQ